ncbi:hypothetical protein HOV93_33260 [Planctomycetes bacterium FF15]|uniref:Secreted protein n=1 Tax=Bremerella alba TaxID=980252 RepID=A0A7V9A877_9BACT|nr:hypothetical protein [Bremerella alba]
MPQLTAIVTLVAMLWHAVAGCCAHHPHAPVIGLDGKVETSAHASDHGSETHACPHSHASSSSGHDAEEGDHHSDPSVPSSCSDIDCVFSASNSDGHLALSKSIGSQLYFDSRCLLSLDMNLSVNDDFALPNSSLHWHVRPPVYIQFQSFLI